MRLLNPFTPIVLLAALVFFSCNKDEANKTKECRIIEEISGNDSTLYQYDSQNQLVKIKRGWYSTTYTYGENEVNVRSSLDVGFVMHQTDYYLNENGVAERSTFSNIDDTMNGTIDSTVYTYDEEGFLIKEEVKRYLSENGELSYSHSLTISHTIKDGNKISSTHTSSEGEMTTTYEYYNLANRSNFDYQPFLGKGNRNLVKTMTTKNFEGEITTTKYAYQLNDNGYPVKMTITDDTTRELLYKYNCD